MAQVDIGRVAHGAPALQNVFIISRPDSKLLRSWSRNDGSQRDHASTLLGNLFRDCDRALETVGGQQQPRTLMIEASDRVVVVARLAEKLAVAFVFEPSAPLGLIRVQARQLTAQLARALSNGRSSASDTQPDSSGPMSERSPAFGVPVLPPPPPPFADPAARGPQSGRSAPLNPRSPAFGVPPAAAPTPRTPVTSVDSHRSPAHGLAAPAKSPAQGVPVSTPMNPRSPAHGVPAANPMNPRSPAHGVPAANPMNPRSPAHGVPATAVRSPAHGVAAAHPMNPRSPAHGVGRPATRAPEQGGPAASSARKASPGPRETNSGPYDALSVRIASFTHSAADPRSALLRLSLRTGIAVDLLDRPAALTPQQAELVTRALNELSPRSTS